MPANRRHSTPRRRASLYGLCALGLTLGLAPAATAETPAPEEFASLIERLDDPDLRTREEATSHLEGMDGPIEDWVRRQVINRDLNPEQLARLETVLESRFREAPRAALGVGFTPPAQVNNRVQHVPVIIDRVLAGFPCSTFIRPGDIIRSVNGRELPPVNGREEMMATILSHLPGEELELVIERDGRRSFVRVPLGDYSKLNNNIEPRADLLNKGWQLRRARLGFDAGARSSLIRCVNDGDRAGLPNLPKREEPDVQAGGSPDNGAALLHLLRSRASTVQANRVAASNVRRIEVKRPGDVNVVGRPDLREQNLGELRAQLQTALTRAIADRERYLRIVGREDLNQTQRQSAIAQLTEIEATIAELKAQLLELAELENADGPEE